MTNERNQARVIFLEAIEYPPEQRAGFLDGACGGDAELRDRVERLLRSHQELGSFHEVHANPAVTLDQPITEKPGTQIGPYKLLQEIGQGGMGVVYMAEQTEPVKRRVALKIIKPGMDTRQVIARFEAERQALSLMDHPNIAKVLDAGTTESGRPYFVMELVRGQPITQYCDEHHLTPRQRLELLLPVCQAIQHAHQKGIIHRDIKPTNILVAEYDQKAVPKVIDFGVAKATSQALTEKTMFTGFGQIVGTLEYMSPEQAKVNQLDIDTRSDIYSLGVLLYELLTGSTPFDKGRLRSAGWDEMLRIIREEEPPKPSTRLSSADTLPSIAANRSMEPARLGRALRGELDWIVMKALEKDRNRRYETATGLASDIQRYLNDEPVAACPPSAGYRFRKFVRRHKGPALAVAIVLLTLIAGVIGTTFGLVRAEQAWIAERQRADAEQQARLETQRREAETNAVLDFLEFGVLSDRLGESEGVHSDLPLGQAIEGALPFIGAYADNPLIEARLCLILGRSSHFLNQDQIAGEQVERALALFQKHGGTKHPGTLACMDALAEIYFPDRLPEVHKHCETALALRKAKLGFDHPDTLWTMLMLAATLEYRGQIEEASRQRNEVVPLLVQAKGSLDRADPQTPASLKKLADCYVLLNGYQDSIPPLEEALALERARLGDRHLMLLPTMYRLCLPYMQHDRHEEGLKLSQEMLQLCQTQLGSDHSRTLAAKDMVSSFHSLLGRQAESEKLGLETYAIRTRREAGTLSAFQRIDLLADEHARSGRYAQAESQYRRTLARKKKILQSFGEGVYPELEREAADTAVKLGELLLSTGRTIEGEGHLDEATGLCDHWGTYGQLTSAYARQSRWHEAAATAQRRVELEPSMHDAWIHVALLTIQTGKVDGYRRACQHLLDHFCKGPEVSPYSDWEIASVCSLAPNSVADFSRIEQLVEKNASQDPSTVLLLGSTLKGLVEYRAGRNESAVQLLRKKHMDAKEPWKSGATSAVLAMAHHQLGEEEAAQEALENARVMVKQEIPAPQLIRDFDAPAGRWWERIIAEVLYREAAAQLNTN